MNASVDNPVFARLLKKLQSGAQQLSVVLSPDQATLLVNYLLLLDKWNRVYNLTAVRNVDEMVGRHVLDSLSVLPWLPEPGATSIENKSNADVLDVGTGAGLPVLPLAICRPDLQFVSVECTGKKARFQQQAVMDLGLLNVRVVEARIEDVYDQASIIVSRAFTAPDKFLQAIEKNTLIDSRIIIMLGLKEQLPDVLPEKFALLDVKEIDVPYCDSDRHIAVCSAGAHH